MPEILLAAGIETAAAIVAVTGEDTVNLSVALAAQRYHPDVRTVVRIFDEDFASKVKHALRVDVVLSASAIAAPIFAASALFANVKASVPVAGGLLVLCDMEVPDDLAPAAPSHLGGYEAQPVLHGAAGSATFVPYEPTTRLQQGDRLLLAVRVPWCAG